MQGVSSFYRFSELCNTFTFCKGWPWHGEKNSSSLNRHICIKQLILSGTSGDSEYWREQTVLDNLIKKARQEQTKPENLIFSQAKHDPAISWESGSRILVFARSRKHGCNALTLTYNYFLATHCYMLAAH